MSRLVGFEELLRAVDAGIVDENVELNAAGEFGDRLAIGRVDGVTDAASAGSRSAARVVATAGGRVYLDGFAGEPLPRSLRRYRRKRRSPMLSCNLRMASAFLVVGVDPSGALNLCLPDRLCLEQ